MTPKLLPCPFCNHNMEETDLQDAFHPSGIYWREDGGFRRYVSRLERKDGDNRCWVLRCLTTEGGCGVSMDGDSAEEVMEKWNTRA